MEHRRQNDNGNKPRGREREALIFCWTIGNLTPSFDGRGRLNARLTHPAPASTYSAPLPPRCRAACPRANERVWRGGGGVYDSSTLRKTKHHFGMAYGRTRRCSRGRPSRASDHSAAALSISSSAAGAAGAGEALAIENVVVVGGGGNARNDA